MILTKMKYPTELRQEYRSGDVFPKWKQQFGSRRLFCEINPACKQFPFRRPVPKTATYGFGELFVGLHFLRRGYEVNRYYFSDGDYISSRQSTIKILGEKAAGLICRDKGTEPPDLFVRDSKNRFAFVEVKLPGDSLSAKQLKYFLQIEECLNKYVSQHKRARRMPEGHWVEVVYLNKK